MTQGEETAEMKVLLVGGDAALLEGLSQSFAALGYVPQVASSLHDARELALATPPLLAIVDRALAAQATGDALAISLVPGGALVLYHASDDAAPAIPPPHTVQRSVMADLALPLERNRLIALAQHVHERVRATGRGRRPTPPEQRL